MKLQGRILGCGLSREEIRLTTGEVYLLLTRFPLTWPVLIFSMNGQPRMVNAELCISYLNKHAGIN